MQDTLITVNPFMMELSSSENQFHERSRRVPEVILMSMLSLPVPDQRRLLPGSRGINRLGKHICTNCDPYGARFRRLAFGFLLPILELIRPLTHTLRSAFSQGGQDTEASTLPATTYVPITPGTTPKFKFLQLSALYAIPRTRELWVCM